MCVHKAYIIDTDKNQVPLFPLKLNKTKLNCASHAPFALQCSECLLAALVDSFAPQISCIQNKRSLETHAVISSILEV